MSGGIRRRGAKHAPFGAANLVGNVEFTIGAEAASRVINVQCQDANGRNIEQKAMLSAYLSDDALGNSIAATAPDTVAAGTDGVYMPLIAGKLFDFVTEDDGSFDLEITENGEDTWYLCVRMPDGSVIVSDAIEFAA